MKNNSYSNQFRMEFSEYNKNKIQTAANKWNINGCTNSSIGLFKMKSEDENEGGGDDFKFCGSKRNGNDNIRVFYENSVIFITGGTGFLGKVLVEKLLRVFMIKRIYLLVRVKNNLTVNERLEQYFKETVFDRLRTESPEVFNKVKAIEAKFDKHDLNISEENKSILWNEVNIVFNVVASVKFNEKLRDAVEINVLGTKKILDLVMGMQHLKTFLHISTLYSNCNRKYIAEKVYEPEFGYEKILQITRIFNDTSLEKLEHCLVEDMPNTYTMTKRCSEVLVNHKAHYLPAGIFRPPIILSTYKEPVPGWTDNLYGPSGLCAGVARGFVHAVNGRSGKRANLVPADYCVNAMISAAWDVFRRYEKRLIDHREMPVYNYIFEENNLKWGQYINLVRNGLHQPLDKAIWYFSYYIIPSKSIFRIANLICHIIPAYVFDTVAYLTGQKRVYVRGYNKLCRVIYMMAYFGLREWSFENTNINRLASDIRQQCSSNSSDNLNLEFELNTIDWKEYFLNYLPGIKKYVFKESLADNEKCRKHYTRLRYMHLIFKSTIRLLFVYLSSSAIWKYVLKYYLLKL